MDGWEQSEKKLLFVLSSSGKPIFSRYGDEQALVATFGLLQAIISIVQDQGDDLRVIKAGSRRIVYFIRQSLYFISVSSTGEPETILSKQLEFLYHQVLFTLTDKVHTVLSQNSSKDLRDLLGYDTTRLMHAACNTELTPVGIAFESIKGCVMDPTLRAELLGSLRNCVETSGAALGLILNSEDGTLLSYSCNTGLDLQLGVSDVLLLIHFVSKSSSLRTRHNQQHWVPLCLPYFNAGAFLQAYICNIQLPGNTLGNLDHSRGVLARGIDMSLVLISSSSDASKFKDLHSGREDLEQALLSPGIAHRLLDTLHDRAQAMSLTKYLAPATCLHFLFVLRRPHPAKLSSAHAPNSAKSAKDHPSLSKSSTPTTPQIPAQYFSTPMDFPFNASESQDKIMLQYQRLGVCLRLGTSLPEYTENGPSFRNIMPTLPTSDNALAYTVLECGYVVVGLATSDSELYATFPGTMTALEACGMANYLSRSLRADSQIFQTHM